MPKETEGMGKQKKVLRKQGWGRHNTTWTSYQNHEIATDINIRRNTKHIVVIPLSPQMPKTDCSGYNIPRLLDSKDSQSLYKQEKK